MKTVTLPSCAGCSYFMYSLKPSMEVNGKTLDLGCRYCVFGKPRRFSTKAERPRVPDWCPRRKFPCDLRIYDFKSTRDRTLFSLFYGETKRGVSPQPHRYAVSFEGQTRLTPRDFWLRCNQVPVTELVGRELPLFSVLEIDDGLEPVCFFRTERRIVPVSYFNTEIARNNTVEDDV